MAHTTIKVNGAIRRALYIYNRHPTYSMEARGSTLDAGSFDCSSFIGTVWGVGYGAWPPATPSMASVYRNYGFDVFTFGDTASYGRLRKGDILVYNGPSGGEGADGHTAMMYNDSVLIECTGSANGVVIGNSPFYLGWQIMIRGSRGISITSWIPDKSN